MEISTQNWPFYCSVLRSNNYFCGNKNFANSGIDNAIWRQSFDSIVSAWTLRDRNNGHIEKTNSQKREQKWIKHKLQLVSCMNLFYVFIYGRHFVKSNRIFQKFVALWCWFHCGFDWIWSVVFMWKLTKYVLFKMCKIWTKVLKSNHLDQYNSSRSIFFTSLYQSVQSRQLNWFRCEFF